MNQHNGRRGPGNTLACLRSKGFTLIELMVVIAIIALLISILLPSLQSAREHAKTAACGSQMRGMGNAFANYLFLYNEWLPGMNTSGVAMESLKFAAGSDPSVFRDEFLPVQPQDWITPLIVAGTTLPIERAKRFKLITDFYKCPSQTAVETVPYPPPLTKFDLPDFAKESWTALSYLQPVYFQMWGQSSKNRKIGSYANLPALAVKPEIAPDTWEVLVDSYESKMRNVGTPARKVFAADGTRYLAASLVLDHDVSPFPSQFGSFTDSGGWWSGSTAYGVKAQSMNWDKQTVGRGSPSEGKNLALTYRHENAARSTDGTAKKNKGTINVLHFDGHVENLNDRDSRQIDLWYPRGAKVQTVSEGMTTTTVGYVVQ